jgi:hypothetical protein
MDPIRPLPPNNGPSPTGDVRPAAGVRNETDARFQVDQQATGGITGPNEIVRPETPELDRLQARINEAAKQYSDPDGIMGAVVRAELETQCGGALTGSLLDQAVERVLEDPGMRRMFQRLLPNAEQGGGS